MSTQSAGTGGAGCAAGPGLGIFAGNRYGLIDRHDRGWDEPAGNGGFLFNGGRLYLDMGHVEYCTAECASAAGCAAPGPRRRSDAAGSGARPRDWRTTSSSSATTSTTIPAPPSAATKTICSCATRRFRSENLLSLLAFLTLRVLFTGSGRVGGAPEEAKPRREVPDQPEGRFHRERFFRMGPAEAGRSSTPGTSLWPIRGNTGGCICCMGTPTSCLRRCT
jgi:hypothetical protein